MTHRLTTDHAKNYCNRTLIVSSYLRKCSHMFFFWDTVYIAYELLYVCLCVTGLGLCLEGCGFRC